MGSMLPVCTSFDTGWQEQGWQLGNPNARKISLRKLKPPKHYVGFQRIETLSKVPQFLPD